MNKYLLSFQGTVIYLKDIIRGEEEWRDEEEKNIFAFCDRK